MRFPLKQALAKVATITAFAVAITSVHILPASADEGPDQVIQAIDGGAATDSIEVLAEAPDALSTSVQVESTDEGVAVEVEAEGLESTVEVVTNEGGPIDELIESLTIDAVVDGEHIEGELLVHDFVYLGEESFSATLEDRLSGEIILLSPEHVTAQAFPVLWVLGLLARVGIQTAIKQIGKTQVKKAAKSYLLNNKGANWNKILAPKHNWNKVGAKSKEQVAEIMSKAMANGKHSAYNGSAHANQAVYTHTYKGKKYTVVVTYAKNGGKISNGWIR